MSELSPSVRGFLERQLVGALATQSAAGQVHQSLVYYVLSGDELLISTLSARRKALDVEETGRASLCVMGPERPFPSLTLYGAAALRREGIGPATALIMQRIMGLDEPPEPQSDEALAQADRVILAVHVERLGPVSYLENG